MVNFRKEALWMLKEVRVPVSGNLFKNNVSYCVGREEWD